MLRERAEGESAFLTVIETEHGDRKNKYFTIVCMGHLEYIAAVEEQVEIPAESSTGQRMALKRTKPAQYGSLQNPIPMSVLVACVCFNPMDCIPGNAPYSGTTGVTVLNLFFAADSGTESRSERKSCLSLRIASMDTVATWVNALFRHSNAATRSIARAAHDVAELVMADETEAKVRVTSSTDLASVFKRDEQSVVRHGDLQF